MSENDAPSTATAAEAPPAEGAAPTSVPGPPHPFNETGLARIMLSDAYREVADRALQGVTTRYDRDHFAGGGNYLEEAASLVRHAEDVLRWAVVYERERRTSWEDIGYALGITKQSAHERFNKHVAAWREPLDRPTGLLPDGTPDDPRIPSRVRYRSSDAGDHTSRCEQTSRDLEHWLLARTTPDDSWADDEHPVTNGLPRHSSAVMVMLLDGIARQLLDEQLVPDPHQQADLADRRVALYERMIRDGDVVPPEIHQWIAKDRARAAALRATPGTGTPWPATPETTEREKS